MRLRQPTDFLILKALAEHGRNVAANLTHHIDKSRKNINTRLPVLADYGLVDRIGPADRAGLYQITPQGRAALELQADYDDIDDFATAITTHDTAATDGGHP
jgi:DNA-binding HxlR family transcriptional regulator